MNTTNDDKLAVILKESGVEETSDLFTKQLTETVLISYRKEVSPGQTVERWLGQGIIAVLILFNLIFLSYLFPFLVQTAIFNSLCAFVIGFYLLMLFMKKFGTSNQAL